MATKKFNAGSYRVGIVASRFNGSVTDGLLKSAKAACREFKVKPQNVTVVSVAGAVEIPFALQVLAKTGTFDCLAALGCVIRGETPHFDYVCSTAQQGALQVSLTHHIPIGFGVLTLENETQARARRHVGGEAVAAALELARLARANR